MAWVTNCPKCGHNRVYNHDAGTCYVCTPKSGPAPKEERMICVDCGKIGLDSPICNSCNEARAARFARITELRAVYDRAYFAVLGGDMAIITREECTVEDFINEARRYALETVRNWPAMQAELDALIGEMST